MKDSQPNQPQQNFRHRDDSANALPGDVIYDESFEFHGYTIYAIVPPPDKVESFQAIVKAYNEAQEATRIGIRAIQQLIPDYETIKPTSEFVEAVYDALIGGLVVGWTLPAHDGATSPMLCNTETKQDLTMTTKAEISRKLIDLFRLYLMVS